MRASGGSSRAPPTTSSRKRRRSARRSAPRSTSAAVAPAADRRGPRCRSPRGSRAPRTPRTARASPARSIAPGRRGRGSARGCAHREHDGRPARTEILGQLRNAACERDLGTDREREVIAAGALEHVRHRQHRKEAVVDSRHAVARHCSTFARMLPCESITPLGRPEVPDVKQIVASVSSATSTTRTAGLPRHEGVGRRAPGASSPERSTTTCGAGGRGNDASAAASLAPSTIARRAPVCAMHQAMLSALSST